ncbi:hypothetical protein AHiyo4_07990 [Arthrobacter sp. Hiyo4]|nr:hypothetical protein AHiyo4_07990 [Arthrobacter sp. Hiyo4]
MACQRCLLPNDASGADSSQARSMACISRCTGSPGTLRWISAFGSRSAISDGRSKLPNRTDMLSDNGRSASRATHVTLRPISSQVPSIKSPPGASRPWTSRQIPPHRPLRTAAGR